MSRHWNIYRVTAHRYCNINFSLNYKIPIKFHSLKSYDAHLIMKELRKSTFKINATIRLLEKYLSSSLGNNFVFMDSFKFLSSSLNSLVKNVGESDFKSIRVKSLIVKY